MVGYVVNGGRSHYLALIGLRTADGYPIPTLNGDISNLGIRTLGPKFAPETGPLESVATLLILHSSSELHLIEAGRRLLKHGVKSDPTRPMPATPGGWMFTDVHTPSTSPDDLFATASSLVPPLISLNRRGMSLSADGIMYFRDVPAYAVRLVNGNGGNGHTKLKQPKVESFGGQS